MHYDAPLSTTIPSHHRPPSPLVPQTADPIQNISTVQDIARLRSDPYEKIPTELRLDVEIDDHASDLGEPQDQQLDPAAWRQQSQELQHRIQSFQADTLEREEFIGDVAAMVQVDNPATMENTDDTVDQTLQQVSIEGSTKRMRTKKKDMSRPAPSDRITCSCSSSATSSTQ